MSEDVKLAYGRNLLVLTFLDTYQGDIGMPVVSRSIDHKYHQRKSVLNFMAAMENAVHAKSYSNIFMTYMKNEEIDDLYRWGEQNKNMQNILALIIGYYENLDRLTYRKQYADLGEPVDDFEFDVAQWKAMVASVFLESCLFYSGFYYPLYFYGQGKLMQAGEIINLILRDESIHGLYIGNLAMELYRKFDAETQASLYEWLTTYLDAIYQEEVEAD
ncbi:ribonucleotide-diphosphate reductase subunit beta [Erysipelothrix sp. Poltava]|nr:ribonucleotide-diphosphate reductase subunit beta [Erysipelothrix sp. Poltava]